MLTILKTRINEVKKWLFLKFRHRSKKKKEGGVLKMDIIKSIEHEQLKNKIPELKVGNTVRVHVRIKEGNKERIQVFEGKKVPDILLSGNHQNIDKWRKQKSLEITKSKRPDLLLK